jgi:hypothetical protein
LPRDFQRGQALRPNPDQKAERLKPRRLREGGKGFDGGVLLHNSVMPEISKLDKAEWLT